ncbi:hypothetical protein [uncultured Limosilactobacillus sp.]|nr:hypothetical protein [uncultured Limosilactobacillus sp.]
MKTLKFSDGVVNIDLAKEVQVEVNLEREQTILIIPDRPTNMCDLD